MPSKSITGQPCGVKKNEASTENKDHGSPQGPQPECTVRDESLGAEEGEGKNPGRVIVCVESSRCRLLDPDNLVGGVKYFIDGLRHSGLIYDDRQEDIILRVSQKKVAKRKEEKTIISLTYP